jgi:putrescine aminotransferase
MPLSAFLSTPKIWQKLETNPFIHTSTFGGNPLACAAGIAAINVTLEEDLPAQAYQKGKYLLSELIALQIRYDRIVKEARGKGLLLGLEFMNTEIGYRVVSGLFRRGILVAGTLTNSRVVRIEPALNIPEALLDEILDKMEDTLKEIDRSLIEVKVEEDD